jgi:putative hemolysin
MSAMGSQLLRRALGLDRIDLTQEGLADATSPADFARRALSRLQVTFEATAINLDRIPSTGAAIVIANHPYGGIEGLYLAACLLERRPDVRILANHMLMALDGLRSIFIPVDPFGGQTAAGFNRTGLRQALRHVADGGVLVMFPAGAVSHLHLSTGRILDPPWSPTAARLIRRAQCDVIPVHFAGSNSALFQLAGLINPVLRTALLPREIFNKRRHSVSVTIGSSIKPASIASPGNDEALASWLRIRTYGLADEGGQGASPQAKVPTPAAVVSPEAIAAEINSLPADATLAASGELRVIQAHSWQLPGTLQEVGRLREEAFRAVGEGTGGAIDLDRHDDHYVHLLAWNDATREIVGGYRIGRTDELVAKFGLRGLYSHSLFAYGRPLLNALGPSLELGRSFIRPQYQRSYVPLLLLWRGICAYVMRHPEYRTLFGPVSISKDYRGASRALLIQYLKCSSFDPFLSKLVRPRRPTYGRHLMAALGKDIARLQDLESVSDLVAALEPDGKGVPVLLRHYLKVGGKLLGFNIDRNFSDAIDGLIAVDLTAVDDKFLQRYMGKEGAASYRAYHQPAADEAAVGARTRKAVR